MGLPSNEPWMDLAEAIMWDVREGVLVVIVSRFRPSVSVVSDVIDVIEEWVTATDFEPPLHALVDIRRARFAPSGQELRVAAGRLGRLCDSVKVALLVEDDFQFGLGKIFGFLSEPSGVDLRPFYKLTEAVLWVRKA